LKEVAVCQALSPELILRHPFLTHSCRTFTINNNLFSNIPPATFASLGTSFTALSMLNNRLTIVGETYFSTLRNLTRLDLRSNLISAIDPASFSNLVSITTLYVSGMAPLWHHHHDEQGMCTMRIIGYSTLPGMKHHPQKSEMRTMHTVQQLVVVLFNTIFFKKRVEISKGCGGVMA
jgi:hypothetical protein